MVKYQLISCTDGAQEQFHTKYLIIEGFSETIKNLKNTNQLKSKWKIQFWTKSLQKPNPLNTNSQKGIKLTTNSTTKMKTISDKQKIKEAANIFLSKLNWPLRTSHYRNKMIIENFNSHGTRWLYPPRYAVAVYCQDIR